MKNSSRRSDVILFPKAPANPEVSWDRILSSEETTYVPPLERQDLGKEDVAFIEKYLDLADKFLRAAKLEAEAKAVKKTS